MFTQVRDLGTCPAMVRAGRNSFLWMYGDTQQNRESVRTMQYQRTLNQRSITKLSPPQRRRSWGEGGGGGSHPPQWKYWGGGGKHIVLPSSIQYMSPSSERCSADLLCANGVPYYAGVCVRSRWCYLEGHHVHHLLVTYSHLYPVIAM